MSDHYRLRNAPNGWAPFEAEGWVQTGGSANSVGHDSVEPRKQPIGFRGANPGASRDDRGLPRIRIKAGSSPA